MITLVNISTINASKQQQLGFGKLSPMGVLKTVDRGLLRASAYLNGLEKEAISLVNPQQSRFSYFIKKEAMSYVATILIPIRRLFQKLKK